MSDRGPTLRIVSINDVYTLENLPRFKTLVRQHAKLAPADAFLVILAGDFLAPYLLSSLDGGRGIVDCLNNIGVTHVVFGNHEDDVPIGALRARVRELRAVCLGTNLRGFDPPLPTHDIVDLALPGARTVRVGLVGVVMSDAAVYRAPPFGGVALLDAETSAVGEAERLSRDFGCACVIPVTHQAMKDDRALARAWRSPPLPLIVGGHEHTVILEREGDVWIVKAGSDAAVAAVIDLSWPSIAPPAGAPDVPSVTVRLDPVAAYAEDAELRAKVDSHTVKVHALESAPLMTLAPGVVLSSVGTRAKQTSMGTLICSRLRDALGAEACLFNAGAIRASRDYRGHVTYGDLKAEVPFDNEIVVVRMPGRVVREAVASSRALAPLESGGFLQVDDRMTVLSPEHRVTAIAGAPLDVDRDYGVAVVRNLLDGMDHIEPLARFGRDQPERLPPHGSGREVKTVLVDAFARALWARLGGFDAVDADHDGRVTATEISEAVARLTHEAPSSVAAALVLHAVDVMHHGAITRDELDDEREKPR
jgi:2',3'-cyclic-nucleotide 2'-phosphodiesterase (5'-nucleotidase family)